jgi:hypothetical protein
MLLNKWIEKKIMINDKIFRLKLKRHIINIRIYNLFGFKFIIPKDLEKAEIESHLILQSNNDNKQMIIKNYIK